MNRFLASALFLTIAFAAVNASAQTNVTRMMDGLRKSLVAGKNFRVEQSHLVLRLYNHSGSEVCAVRLVSGVEIEITATVARMPVASNAAYDRLAEQIDLLNTSSAIGTIWPDAATGTLTMMHRLNPQKVTGDELLRTVMLFSRTLESSRPLLTGLMAGDVGLLR